MDFSGGFKMALTLRADTSAPDSFVSGLHVNNPTWWFWVKAGMGLAIGFGVVFFTFALLWWTFWLRVLLDLTRRGL